MRRRILSLSVGIFTLLAVSSAITAQSPVPHFTPIQAPAFDHAGPALQARTESLKPFTVAGEHGVLLGEQNGTFEAWVLPVKVLSHLTIEADIEGYTVPIDVNQQSAEIEVRPDRTVLTYSHIGFTVRQIMFSPNNAPAGTGPVVLFQFDCLHPTDFTLRFTPNLEYMWPERNEGVPSAEWVAPGPNAWEQIGGYYVLHSDYPDLAAAITMPGARAGILAPYQERPQVHPVELKVHIDPVQDKGKLYPLLMAVGTNTTTANTLALGQTLEKLNASIGANYTTHAESYRKLLSDSASIETPDKALDEAFQWAVVSIEQLKAKPVGTDETALVAGYYASGDSARPGFGWFFGRDALYTLYAVDGYGDFGLAKSELEFLIHRQRDDGKIMHEYSQTAAAIDWKAFPYMYAAADATPLFLLATLDYVRASGDVAFLTANREAIEKAWAFETGHADSNGIYANTQGTGWVESWPGGMPHQEVYLALLDQQASSAMFQIEALLKDTAGAQAARTRADAIAKTINAQFYDAEKGCYAFSRNANGSLDKTTTVYPALAWWSDLEGSSDTPTHSILQHPEGCLRQFADATLDTDWGLRDVSNKEKDYDGMSYHQGSVWPLFTGWAALAEYRAGQPQAGYRMLMQNTMQTRTQDLGSVTELLSGDFFVPFGRSTSHQLWSSAMVITPILRGLFGLDVDAQTRTITVNPHLPASWDHAEVLNLHTPDGPAGIYFKRVEDHLEVSLGEAPEGWKLHSKVQGATEGPIGDRKLKKTGSASPRGVRIPQPALAIDATTLELNLSEEAATFSPGKPPLAGARTQKFRILESEDGQHSLKLTLQGMAGSDGVVRVIRSGAFVPKVQAEGGEASLSTRGCDAKPEACATYPLSFHFPEGDGWKTMTVTLEW